MSRGFEENVPRVRPRVRLNRAGDEVVEAEREEEGAPQLELATSAETENTRKMLVGKSSRSTRY